MPFSSRRVRVGVALHAAINVAFGVAALVVASGPVPTRVAADGRAPGSTRQVVSTGYCLEGTTADGRPPAWGMVAMNDVAFGTQWQVTDGPLAGSVLEVADRIGHGTEFDIWFPSCTQARDYGRRTIRIHRA